MSNFTLIFYQQFDAPPPLPSPHQRVFEVDDSSIHQSIIDNLTGVVTVVDRGRPSRTRTHTNNIDRLTDMIVRLGMLNEVRIFKREVDGGVIWLVSSVQSRFE